VARWLLVSEAGSPDAIEQRRSGSTRQWASYGPLHQHRSQFFNTLRGVQPVTGDDRQR